MPAWCRIRRIMGKISVYTVSIIRIHGWRQNDLVQALSNEVLRAAHACGAALHTAEPSCCIVIVQYVE